MNTQVLIDEALDYKEWALRKLQADTRQQIDVRRDHALASGISGMIALQMATEWFQTAKQMLTQSETFVWTPETERRVLQAATKLPHDVAFHPAWLPAPVGYWWLGRESQWTLPCETHRNVFPDLPVRRRVCSITYKVEGVYVLIEAQTLEHREPTRGPVTFIGAAWHVGETLSQFIHRVWTDKVSSVRDQQYAEFVENTNEWWRDGVEEMGRIFMSAALWLQQRVVSVSPRQPSRPQQKRAAKLEMNSNTKIVLLRRYESDQTSDGTGTGQPLQWRVPVMGHWRNQPYPSKGCTIPIWIDEHWRGDPDAPVKAPSKIIYKVAR